MKARTKTILSLTGTLIIGMVLGGLITMRIVNQRIDNLRELRNRKGFSEHIIKAAKPDADQEEAIRPLLEEFGDRMESLSQIHKGEVKRNLTELQDSLALHLNEKQMKRVRKRLKRMHGRHKKGKHPPGFPPPPPPKDQ